LIKALYGLQGGGKICVVQPVLRAIVPVLKSVDCRSGIECDISIENKDGI
jgi:DNA polymerase sigma